MKRFTLLSILILIYSLANANIFTSNQTSPSGQGKLSIEINGGLLLGGEINRDNFTFKSGPAFFISPAYHISERWSVELLFGLMSTPDELILPFGAGMKYYLRESMPSAFFSFYGGYAEAWAKEDFSDDFILRGNWFLQPGFGYQIPLTDKIHGVFGFAFHHQRANLRYRDPAIEGLSIAIDWDYLHLRIGLVF